jgi:hypothetical protein
MSTIAVNAITDANDGNTTTINGVTPNSANVVGKNKIINGNMVIDQRNAGASVTTNGAFPVDRFLQLMSGGGVLTSQRSTTAPAGFSNGIYTTVSTADASIASTDYYLLRHVIEGLNVSDLNWGTAAASAVTLSFKVRSSVTGTFSGSLTNSAEDRCYPFTYSISIANTWTNISVTIPGDTSGTWLTTNGVGIRVNFDLGTGSTRLGTANTWGSSAYFGATGSIQLISTLNATFYITGVQLEVGETATEFEHRPYGTELQLCQRYYFEERKPTYGTFSVGRVFNNKTPQFGYKFPTPMRTLPSVSNAGSGCAAWYGSTSFTRLLSPAYYQEDSSKQNVSTVSLTFAANASLTDNNTITLSSYSTDSGLSFSAEL